VRTAAEVCPFHRIDAGFGQAHPVLEQLGVDALDPHVPLIEQGLVQPDPFPPLQHRLGRDPAFGQLSGL